MEIDTSSSETPSIELAELIRKFEFLLKDCDEKTQSHSLRVAALAGLFYPVLEAQGLQGLDGLDRETLIIAAFLHDIGKGDSRIAPLATKLEEFTESERDQMQNHHVIGAEIAKNNNLPIEVVEIIKHHHEHYNGGGYPDCLKGEGIPLGARIVAVLDAFDVMTVGRPYQEPISEEDALEELEEKSDSQFDPEVVSSFIDFRRNCWQLA